MYKGIIMRITTGWSFMRGLRFFLSVFILISAIKSGDVLIIMGGGFLLAQSLLGLGCCSTGQCNSENFNEIKPHKDSDVIFEEIKN